MKVQQPNKSHTLLAKIGNSDVTTESQLLKDRGLLELFSWGSDRAPRARIKDTLALLVKQGDITLGSIESERIYRLTAAGKQKLQLSHFRIAAAKRPATWNQRWHFVTYQILRKSHVTNLLLSSNVSAFDVMLLPSGSTHMTHHGQSTR